MRHYTATRFEPLSIDAPFHAMPIPLNLRFNSVVANDAEYLHPHGAALMRELLAGLAKAPCDVGELENWRDCGWSVECRCGDAKLQIVLCGLRKGEWMLRLHAAYRPGIIGCVLGRTPSASPAEIHRLAETVHELLAARHLMTGPRWRWDGFPDGDCGAQVPPPA